MRLKQIKLVGFKSFVDPTIFSLQPQLIGIVGPNGCGKSNIIDAVRWVLGESSAKDLRGESMLDVIFNGSNVRKPVGRAAVELLFDNQEEKLNKEYANFSEVSIRREVDRARQSDYYLNGRKCRRRDITDLFAGTGLSQNGYAIISQGTVSQIIESKPEELRLFIEEAADISIYKKRRHETELRMGHAEDNLVRLQDLTKEQERVLEKLEKQSHVAIKYGEYNQKKQQIEIKILTIKAQKFTSALNQHNQNLTTLSLQLEQLYSQKTKIVAQLEQQKLSHMEQADNLADSKNQHYKLTAEITKLEQILQHKYERITKVEQELIVAAQNMIAITSEAQQEQELNQALASQLLAVTQEHADNLHAKEIAEKHYTVAQLELQQTQELCNQVQLELQRENHLAEQYRSSLEQVEQLSKELTFRIDRLTQENISYDQSGVSREILLLEHDLMLAKQALTTQQQQLAAITTQIDPKKLQIKNLLQEKNILQTNLYELQGKIGSLQTLQHVALECNNSKDNWLNANNISQNGLFFKQLNIEDGWEIAVAIAFNQYLDGILLSSSIKDLSHDAWESIKDFRLSLIDPSTKPLTASYGNTNSSRGLVSIATKVSNNCMCVWLEHVYIADNLRYALEHRVNLLSNEYFITKNGEMIGANWLIIDRIDNKQKILLRNKELRLLQQQLQQIDTNLMALDAELTAAEQHLLLLETEQQDLAAPLAQQEGTIRTLIAKLSTKQSELQSIKNRVAKIELEIKEYQEKIVLFLVKINEFRANLASTIENIANLTADSNELSSRKLALQTKVEPLLVEYKEATKKLHASSLQQQQLTIKHQNAENLAQKLATQVHHLSSNNDKLQLELNTSRQDLPLLQQQLAALLEHKSTTEDGLNQAQDELNHTVNNIHLLEQQHTDLVTAIETLKEQLTEVKLAQQAATIHLDELQAMGKNRNDINLLEVLNDTSNFELEDQVNVDELQTDLERINNKIQKLGAVNLAAVEELKIERERYDYLFSQLQDVTNALDTLRNAIVKIDLETTKKFTSTFEQVNYNFQQLFPQLFGGGSAYLALAEQNLLESGVSVFAQPPGKKNSSIYLLSGGEKALTAVALIFAIFQLNPAPFCILDEVDAPLDEANVIRFSELIRSMSSKVQFVFITHNKTTMKIANQLIGVTMKEAGVSRLVSVNVDEAVELID